MNERAGIELLMEQNNKSIQNTELNEHTIVKMIERNQVSVLTGNTMRPPANFSNQDIVARTIEANQLTIHSVHTFEGNSVEPGLLDHGVFNSPLESATQFLREGTGLFLGIGIIIAFFFAAAVRISSGILNFNIDIWLAYLFRQNEDDKAQYIAIYGVFCVAIAISVLFRSFGFAHVILSKSMSWHKRLLEVI